jgi:cation:H+ antiporter
LAIVLLAFGIAILTYSSIKAIEHSVYFASAIRVSPLLIGLILLSIGTDLPEIVNSIVSSAAGHGDINIGDSLGSILSQMTLVLGLVPFLGVAFKVERREILVLGGIEILSLISVLAAIHVGLTQTYAFLLIASWPILMFIVYKTTSINPKKVENYIQTDNHYLFHLMIACLSFLGVSIGAISVVESVIMLSTEFNVPEFFISFFVLGVGTSLPELVVNVEAYRKKQYELVIGDILGSCIVDALIAIPIGPLFFPVAVTNHIALTMGLYVILASLLVIMILAWREIVDKKAGAVLIILYNLSFLMLFIM